MLLRSATADEEVPEALLVEAAVPAAGLLVFTKPSLYAVLDLPAFLGPYILSPP